MKFPERVADDLPNEAILLKATKKISAQGKSIDKAQRADFFINSISIGNEHLSDNQANSQGMHDLPELHSSFRGFYEKLLDIQLRAFR